jgi:hypothetical protein
MSTHVYPLTVGFGWCTVRRMTRTRHNRNPEKRLRQREHITHDVQAPNDYSVVSCSVVDVRTSARYRKNRAMVEDSYHKVRDNNLPILNNTREHMARPSPQPIQHDLNVSHTPVRASFYTPVECHEHPQAMFDKSRTYRECKTCRSERKETPRR